MTLLTLLTLVICLAKSGSKYERKLIVDIEGILKMYLIAVITKVRSIKPKYTYWSYLNPSKLGNKHYKIFVVTGKQLSVQSICTKPIE